MMVLPSTTLCPESVHVALMPPLMFRILHVFPHDLVPAHASSFISLRNGTFIHGQVTREQCVY